MNADGESRGQGGKAPAEKIEKVHEDQPTKTVEKGKVAVWRRRRRGPPRLSLPMWAMQAVSAFTSGMALGVVSASFIPLSLIPFPSPARALRNAVARFKPLSKLRRRQLIQDPATTPEGEALKNISLRSKVTRLLPQRLRPNIERLDDIDAATPPPISQDTTESIHTPVAPIPSSIESPSEITPPSTSRVAELKSLLADHARSTLENSISMAIEAGARTALEQVTGKRSVAYAAVGGLAAGALPQLLLHRPVQVKQLCMNAMWSCVFSCVTYTMAQQDSAKEQKTEQVKPSTTAPTPSKRNTNHL
ncbi:hypothetical protein Pelo_14072 [Pelomyxa schiedti]|nr:hypothetical protein Pelo_14072 [Pelomyxa schiedti]